MYHQLPTLTASLASRLSDMQNATFLIVWFLSLGFCSFCYIEIKIRNCFSIEWLFSWMFKLTKKKKSSVFLATDVIVRQALFWLIARSDQFIQFDRKDKSNVVISRRDNELNDIKNKILKKEGWGTRNVRQTNACCWSVCRHHHWWKCACFDSGLEGYIMSLAQ